MRTLSLLIIIVILCLTSTLIMSQDTDDEEREAVTATLWFAKEEDSDADDEPRYVAFLFMNDSETIVEAGFGADVLYHLGDDGLYSGQMLVPSAFEFTATLEIIDDETIQVSSETTSGTFTTASDITYTLTEIEANIWIENPREIIEFSKFGECMGRDLPDPPGAFADADPILPIIIDDEVGELRLGPHVLLGGGDAYELEVEGQFGQFPDVTTRTAIVGDESIDFSYYSIADGRDDCEMIYESSYVLYDGDFEAMMEQINDMSEEE